MKHPQIATALGWTEEPSTEEGLFLQPEEATTIDTALATGETAAQDLVVANETIAANNVTLGEMTTAAKTASEAATVQTNRISELEATVARLNGETSGAAGSKIPAGGADTPPKEATVTTGLPRFDDPNHPANIAAAKIGRGTKA